MVSHELLINILIGLIGFLIGCVAIYPLLMKKIGSIGEETSAQSQDIKTLFRDTKEISSKYEHAIELITKIVDQNNLLIQKITTNHN